MSDKQELTSSEIARQRRAQGSALRRMLSFGFEEEGMLAPDIDAAFGPERLIDFGDFRGGRDRVTDNPAANIAHDMSDSAVAVNDAGHAWVLRFLGFHGGTSK